MSFLENIGSMPRRYLLTMVLSMKNIGLKSKRRKNVRRISFFVLVAFLITGCAPSYSGWTNSKDAWVGTTLDSHNHSICQRHCGGSLWSPVNKNRVFDRVVAEGKNKRIYITWIRDCHYSVLVSEEGIIRAWRPEGGSDKNCYIY